MFAGIKKQSLATPIGEQAPINTPEANNGTALKNNISDSSEKNKQKFSDAFFSDEEISSSPKTDSKYTNIEIKNNDIKNYSKRVDEVRKAVYDTVKNKMSDSLSKTKPSGSLLKEVSAINALPEAIQESRAEAANRKLQSENGEPITVKLTKNYAVEITPQRSISKSAKEKSVVLIVIYI